MARFGSHIRQGGRNGYGQFCVAKPAVVLAVDEGGALLEAKDKSGGYTVTIFRDTSVYLEAPPGFNDAPDMVALARQYYPLLKAKWQQNPSDYRTITNEQGGNDPAVMRRLVEYEREVMRLANADGLKVAVLNLATGTPESLDQWRQIYAPFIVEAWQGRNLYARHVYGTGDLVDGSGNVVVGDPSRPFIELGYFRSLEATGGIVLTECGLDAGFGFAGIERFQRQLGGYEKLLGAYPEFVGECAWTLGLWNPFGEDANWQPALPAMTQYLIANPTAKWEWPNAVPPTPIPPPTTGDKVVIESTAGSGNLRLEPGTTALKVGNAPNGTEFKLVEELPDWYGIEVYVSKTVAHLVDDVPVPPTPGLFRATAWPTPTLHTTQWFAANPQNYAQFGLPGHDGQDGRALTGEPIYAMADGTVYLAGLSQDSPNYGVQVRIDHGNGHKTVSAHFQEVRVTVGQVVTAGQLIGTADSTGNSTGSHWHGTYKRDGLTYTDPAGNVWPRNLHDPWLMLEPLYLEYLGRAGIAGFLWANSTVEHPHFGWGFGITNLNLRQEGKTDSPILGLVQAGVPFRITGPKTAGGYYPAVALLGDRVPGGVPVPEPGGRLIDLREFKIADPTAWRVVKSVDENGRQGQEDVQDLSLGGGVYVIRKNDNGEWRKVDSTNFYLIHDTSPAPDSQGNDRVYTLYKGNVPGAPKSAIHQRVGERWAESGQHRVQFRAKSDCRPLAENSGLASNGSVITSHERNYRFNGFGQNLIIDEVIIEQTGVEKQFYGRHQGKSLGWIGWIAPWGFAEPVEIYFDRGKLTEEPNRFCSW